MQIPVKPLLVSEASQDLSDPFPDKNSLLRAVKAMKGGDRERFCRLWLSEGVPFGFRSNPMLFEVIRDWLALRLRIHPKEITLVGSARIGYSLAGPNFGRPFRESSDLDFTAISEKLFEQLAENFFRWESDYSRGVVHPQNNRQSTFWEDNLQRLPVNIRRGLIDTHEIPAWNRYPLAQRIADTLYRLGEHLKVTPNCPRFCGASLRVYRDWQAFFSQIVLNFSRTMESVISSSTGASH